jgi:hypothetical protein
MDLRRLKKRSIRKVKATIKELRNLKVRKAKEEIAASLFDKEYAPRFF